MLGRFVLVGMTIALVGTTQVAVAGPYLSAWKLKRHCEETPARVVQCGFQFAKGNRNWAATKQTTVQHGSSSSLQFSYTRQVGDDNTAFTQQNGKNQSSTTIQVGDGNFAGTHQVGRNQSSTTVQLGDGHWAATSSVGSGTETNVVTTSW